MTKTRLAKNLLLFTSLLAGSAESADWKLWLSTPYDDSSNMYIDEKGGFITPAGNVIFPVLNIQKRNKAERDVFYTLRISCSKRKYTLTDNNDAGAIPADDIRLDGNDIVYNLYRQYCQAE